MTMNLPNIVPSFGAGGVVAAVVLGILLLKLFSSKPKNLPPGPRGLPIIGHLHLLGKHPHEDLAKLSATYGSVMSLWFGHKLALVVSSPAAAEEILKTQGHNFSSRIRTSFGELIVTNDIAFPDDTAERRHLKKILHTQLSTTKQIQLSENVRAEEISHVIRVMPQDGKTVVPVKTYVEVMVTNILSRMILKKRFSAVAGKAGADQGAELQEVRNFRVLVEEITACSFHLDPGDFIPIFKLLDIQGFRSRLRNLRKRMDVFINNIISEHLEQRKSGQTYEKDMVDVLLDQMEDETSRFDISEKHINGLVWNSFIGGTEATIDVIEWALSECIRNPKLMIKVQDELDTVVGKSRRVEDADIPNLKYLQAMVKEVFRLHLTTPILLPKVNKTACKLFGYDIPAGTTVLVCAGTIARDPSIWDNPLEFRPERFLDGSPHVNTEVQGNHFELLTFGSGRRGCPGTALAITMVHILTATLLHSFDWTLPNGTPPMDLDMSDAPGRVHRRAKPLNAILKARLSI
ncbi:hypothetical protein M758_12G020400 [Ceratodon purpureus]|nr:hypothetical protein M758_12G020400 [Ceratodon purpureus]